MPIKVKKVAGSPVNILKKWLNFYTGTIVPLQGSWNCATLKERSHLRTISSMAKL